MPATSSSLVPSLPVRRVMEDLKRSVTSGFGWRIDPNSGEAKMHSGVDFGMPLGTGVKVPADGTVSFVGVKQGYGNVIQIQHANKLVTTYGHLKSFAPGLHAGSAVKRGEVIARVGYSGNATDPHLHYEISRNGADVNPMTFRIRDAGRRLPFLPDFAPAEPVKVIPEIKFLMDRFEKPVCIAADFNRGLTCYGVNSQANPDLSVKLIENLPRHPEVAADIFKVRYWDYIGANKLAPGARLEALDAAIQFGPDRAKQWIRDTNGDGDAIHVLSVNRHEAIIRDDAKRLKALKKDEPALYKQLMARNAHIHAGWTARDETVLAHANDFLPPPAFAATPPKVRVASVAPAPGLPKAEYASMAPAIQTALFTLPMMFGASLVARRKVMGQETRAKDILPEMRDMWADTKASVNEASAVTAKAFAAIKAPVHDFIVAQKAKWDAARAERVAAHYPPYVAPEPFMPAPVFARAEAAPASQASRQAPSQAEASLLYHLRPTVRVFSMPERPLVAARESIKGTLAAPPRVKVFKTPPRPQRDAYFGSQFAAAAA